jgi:hypothetical protein
MGITNQSKHKIGDTTSHNWDRIGTLFGFTYIYMQYIYILTNNVICIYYTLRKKSDKHRKSIISLGTALYKWWAFHIYVKVL